MNEFQFSDLKKLSQLLSETVNPGVVGHEEHWENPRHIRKNNHY
ncbi:hypothetical protein [Lactobacillus equicursoris]